MNVIKNDNEPFDRHIDEDGTETIAFSSKSIFRKIGNDIKIAQECGLEIHIKEVNP